MKWRGLRLRRQIRRPTGRLRLRALLSRAINHPSLWDII